MASKAWVAYQNLLEQAALVTASSAVVGYPVRYAYDWSTATYWQPVGIGTHTLQVEFSSPVSADYLALYRHNFAQANAIIKLQYDDGGIWFDCFDAMAATDNQLIFKRFTQQTSSLWRIVITNTQPVFIGVLMFGQALNLERGMSEGFTPPRHGRDDTILDSTSEGGAFLSSRLVRQGAESDLTINWVTSVWLRQHGEPFMAHARLKPFVFSWNDINYPQDVCFCKVKGKINNSSIKARGWQSLSMRLNCLLSGE